MHYLPVAGDLIFPLNSDKKPEIRYVAGDSVSLTIAESASDFHDLIGNHARDVDQFYEFVPQIDPVTDESEYQRVPVMALKVTLFPGRDLSLKTHLELIPSSGKKERGSFEIIVFSIAHQPGPRDICSPSGRYKKAQGFGLGEETGSTSSLFFRRYGVLCLDLLCEIRELVDDDVPESFIFAADIRARIGPPVPAKYFGNCLGGGFVNVEHKQLVGEEGFVTAGPCRF
ncbi:UNVERIFIED_CONTAM: Malonyl-coenzyme:anthocyanin 5-O-glucoside-6'''-O-malonyltransferase [Sesamum angustifolium]|uniref:Malonyl-coenzyme:anthocyanin 5-O-glucoside-6'''-O-malonyltransferase n=1 Tax=Sesamum angustifolium TaxID=2727405 RepID=A0AAW2PDE1_9LAMI